MIDDSPVGLRRPTVSVRKISGWPLLVGSVMVAGLAIILIYAVEHGGKSKAPAKEEEKSSSSSTQLTPGTQSGFGLSLENKNGPPLPGGTGIAGAPTVHQPAVFQAPSAEEKEASRIQQQRTQDYQSALKAPLQPKRVSTHAAAAGQPGGAGKMPVNAGDIKPIGFDAMASLQNENAYNPAADKDKEGFLARTDNKDGYLNPHTREAGRPFEIKTGTVIPGIMITGINSDLPGPMIAQVSQDVYDTATGSKLLVPQGSKIFGMYDSRVIYGQERVLIAWNRIVFPDGSSVALGAMPGADMSGAAGFNDQVNNHYLRIFGSAILMSFITGSTSYAVDSMNNSSSTSNDNGTTTVQSALGASLAQQLDQTALAMLQKNLNVKPTLEIRQGYQFNIVCTKDVVFRDAYKPYKGVTQ
jgi:type IV secretion system protein VirB10